MQAQMWEGAQDRKGRREEEGADNKAKLRLAGRALEKNRGPPFGGSDSRFQRRGDSFAWWPHSHMASLEGAACARLLAQRDHLQQGLNPSTSSGVGKEGGALDRPGAGTGKAHSLT